MKINLKKAGNTVVAALAMTGIIFFMDINFYNDNDYTAAKINEILFWSFVRSLVISVAVHIGNCFRTSKK